jgi:hypothetical protein
MDHRPCQRSWGCVPTKRGVSKTLRIGVYFPHFMVAGLFDVEAALRRHLVR